VILPINDVIREAAMGIPYLPPWSRFQTEKKKKVGTIIYFETNTKM